MCTFNQQNKLYNYLTFNESSYITYILKGKTMENFKIMQVINHVFETFYDDNNNTKHLDSDFAEQIVEVEKYLTTIFGDDNEN